MILLSLGTGSVSQRGRLLGKQGCFALGELRPGCIPANFAPCNFLTLPGCRPPPRPIPSQTEDRPVMKERVTRLREHRPVEKEFVVGGRALAVWQWE